MDQMEFFYFIKKIVLDVTCLRKSRGNLNE